MKKRLLLGFAALCTAFSGYALEQGEFVYTPQGRFQITGANVAASTFEDFTGWTVVTATEGKTLADNFNVVANGYAEGLNSVVSLDATAGEGMYFKFEPSDAGATYVVSFKMKGAALVTTRLNTIGYNGSNANLGDILPNGVKIEGNSDHEFRGTNDVVVANTAEELTENWQTFNYAIVGDGTARTYFISFVNMATNVEIADLQIAPALQFADLRQRDAMLEKLNAYKNCYEWSEDLLAEYAVTETIANLEAIGDESGQADLEEQLNTAEEVLAEFLDKNMDDYLAGKADNYLSNTFSSAHSSKQSTYGDWNCLPGGRGHWSANAYPDMGHYQKGSKWNYGNTADPMGMYTQKTLDPGSYLFAISGNGAMREDAQQTWVVNEGLKPAYGVAYIVKIVDGAATDTIASLTKDVESVKMTPFYLTAKIEESATYELGLKVYAKEAYRDLILGSVAYIGDASIWGKNENQYNQKQLGYEADVREQITTGRNNLTTAKENLAKAEYFWGKAELQACVDTVETKIAAYELKTQDEIIATFDADVYNKANSTKNAEEGLMVFEVYNEAVRDILAANKKFQAVNDTLNSVQTAIAAAENTLSLRLYDQATGKAALQAAIDKAKGVQTQMKATDYSEENAAAIKAANAELAEAVETFKTTVPASAITTIVDIDFENDPAQNAETQLYSISGAAGTMEFSNFASDVSDSYPFQQGYWSNGEQQWKGYVRVGNGTGTVNFDPTENGSMGSNILKVSFDFFLQGLSGKFVGFYLKDESGENNVAGFFANYYDNKIDATSNLNIDLGSLKYASGSGYNNAAPEGAEPTTTNVCAKNSFEIILDFGEGSMYATTTSAKGVVTTAKQAFDKTVPRSFVLQSNYINNDRRVWFDNLKIERIVAGETDPFVDGIREVNTINAKAGAIYNLNGVQVSKASKPGLYIIDGKKVLVK
jgi:hypothetical protein